jgi:5-methylcytosine-specific restriction enzyme subunit McrC
VRRELPPLKEYEWAYGVELSVEERDQLVRMVKGLIVNPSPGSTDQYDIRPGAYVGSIETPTLSLVIVPKVPIDSLFFLLSYSLGIVKWLDMSHFVTRPSVFSSIAAVYLRLTEQALHRGVLAGYQAVEESLATVRGKIRLSEQVRRRFGIGPPIEVDYDDFTTDIVENRLLRAAARALLAFTGSDPRLNRDLRRLDTRLAEVSLIQYDRRAIPTVAYTRLNDHYRPAAELARLILASIAFEVHRGNLAASAFIVDMNLVFERFVFTALRNALNLSQREFRRGVSSHLFLAEDSRIELKPDLSWWKGDQCVFVGDAKYKVPASDIPNADVYQALAYTVGADLPGAILVYPAGERDPGTYRIPYVNRTVEIACVDLSSPPHQLVAQMADVADRVEVLRHRHINNRSLPWSG